MLGVSVQALNVSGKRLELKVNVCLLAVGLLSPSGLKREDFLNLWEVARLPPPSPSPSVDQGDHLTPSRDPRP